MRKKRKNTKQKLVTNGFDNLIGVHTAALEENSDMIALMLQAIADKTKNKPLSIKDKESLKKITRELKSIDKDLEDLEG